MSERGRRWIKIVEVRDFKDYDGERGGKWSCNDRGNGWML